ncbi:hypothetical protein FMEAI12_2440013 [Parafrankia sp. Ea1.12]|nr:hypothetical protein FMEAI12_2440013 [Parafrankia sp. Ea1.12]
MVAVGPAWAHPEVEVDLGGSANGDGRQGAAGFGGASTRMRSRQRTLLGSGVARGERTRHGRCWSPGPALNVGARAQLIGRGGGAALASRRFWRLRVRSGVRYPPPGCPAASCVDVPAGSGGDVLARAGRVPRRVDGTGDLPGHRARAAAQAAAALSRHGAAGRAEAR